MNSSPSRFAAAAAAAPAKGAMVGPFPYDAIPPGGSLVVATASGPNGTETACGEARALGRQEGREEARKAFEEQMRLERASMAAAVADFSRERTAYFGRVESEVVQLALSIARKILHREAQLDPLLLAGITRVALEKIDGATRVILRLHPENAPEWRRYFSTRVEPASVPEVVEDPAQPVDCCTLETSMGTATVGLEVQLKEIEQGFMDLLAARPGAAS